MDSIAFRFGSGAISRYRRSSHSIKPSVFDLLSVRLMDYRRDRSKKEEWEITKEMEELESKLSKLANLEEEGEALRMEEEEAMNTRVLGEWNLCAEGIFKCGKSSGIRQPGTSKRAQKRAPQQSGKRDRFSKFTDFQLLPCKLRSSDVLAVLPFSHRDLWYLSLRVHRYIH